jgi:hypothetical protein
LQTKEVQTLLTDKIKLASIVADINEISYKYINQFSKMVVNLFLVFFDYSTIL